MVLYLLGRELVCSTAGTTFTLFSYFILFFKWKTSLTLRKECFLLQVSYGLYFIYVHRS